MFSLSILAAETITGVSSTIADPNGGGLPGGAKAVEFLQGIMYYGTILTIAGFVLSAGFWAVGSFSGNYTQSVNGKKGFICCAAAALVVGGSYALTAFFFEAGARV